MNENAPYVEYVEETEAGRPEQPDFLVRHVNSGSDGPKFRYMISSVKPDLPTRAPVLSDVVSAVANESPRRQFAKPAVWAAPSVEKETFVALQRWEGTVTACGGETFLARLNDLTSGGLNEEVELLMDDVPEEDRPLVEPGAVFYWSVGHLVKPSGERPRISSLRFRRLPVWSSSELEAARERATDVAEVFDGN